MRASPGFPVIAVLLFATPAPAQQVLATLTGPAHGGNAGWAVALVNDLNGDGRGDFVLGMPFYDGNGVDSGRVSVRSGLDQSVLLESSGGTGDHYGHALASLGDVNGDGRGDFAVGAPYADNGAALPDAGRVLIVSGLDGLTIASVSGTQANEHLGWSVAYAGKVGATPRIVVGAPHHTVSGLVEAGRALLYTTSFTLLRERRGTQTGEHFGLAVGGDADVDLDGTPDWIVGAPDFDSVFVLPDAGRVEVLSGATGNVLFAKSGSSAGPGFGAAVALIRDTNGDFRGDFLIGAPRFSLGATPETGKAQLFTGVDGSLLREHLGFAAHEHFGFAVADLGDTNSDLRDDYVIGAPDAPGSIFGLPSTGVATIFSGVSGAKLGSIAGLIDTPIAGRMGFSVAGGVDVDLDGRADVIAAAPFGEVYGEESGAGRVVKGNTAGQLHFFVGKTAGSQLGAEVEGIGDVDGDGVPDVAVGAPREHLAVGMPATFAPSVGAVRVVSGATGAVVRVHSGGAANDFFGGALANCGDLDLDGVPDYAIGAPRSNFANIGFVTVFSGATGGTLFTFAGASAAEAFGDDVAGGTDVNADGRPDILVGAPFHTAAGLTRRGRVVAFSGASGGQLFAVEGLTAEGNFGRALDGLGDVNGDGFGDFLVGAPLADGFGRGYVVSGQSHAILRTHGPSTVNTAWFGWACARIGDANFDGIADYAIGSPRENANSLFEPGVARIYSGASGTQIVARVGSLAFDHLGWSLAAAGDFDVDGRADLLAGGYPAMQDFLVDLAPGFAEAISAASGNVFVRSDGSAIGDRFGASVAGSGDVNGDGVPDAVVGVPDFDTNVAQADQDNGRAHLISLAPTGLTAFGQGTPGCAGPMHLFANSKPTIGNGAFAARMNHASPASQGFLVLGTQATPAGADPLGVGAVFYVDLLSSPPFIVLQTTSNAAGFSSTPLPIPNNPLLAGLAFHLQGVWPWPATCVLPPQQLSTTNGLTVQLQ